MSKIVRVQGGDYRIVVGSQGNPGTIYLDTSPSTDRAFPQGDVVITGDLTVLGKSTIVQSETLAIKDNIVYINQGETGNGVSTLGTTAGIDIDRGNEIDVSILWDESLDLFKFVDANNNFIPIATDSIITNGNDLHLISEGSGIITVAGTVDYETNVLDYNKLTTQFNIVRVSRSSNISTITVGTDHLLAQNDLVDINCISDNTFSGTFIRVLDIISSTSFTYVNTAPNVVLKLASGIVRLNPVRDDDIIPNIRAVADYANSLLQIVGNKIQENDTKVQTSDFDTSGVSEITFEVDGELRAIVNNNGLNVDNIRIRNNAISNFSNDNLLIDSVLNISNRSGTPTTPIGYVKLYSKNIPENGGTGIFFVNTTGTSDELISRSKSLLYSLIL
jgi:hypothetical protein